MTPAHDSVPPCLPCSLAPSVLFLRNISQIICLHPGPCFRPCLQGNPGSEESQGLSEIGDAPEEDTEAQKRKRHTQNHLEPRGMGWGPQSLHFPSLWPKTWANRPCAGCWAEGRYTCTRAPGGLYARCQARICAQNATENASTERCAPPWEAMWTTIWAPMTVPQTRSQERTRAAVGTGVSLRRGGI